MFKKGQLVQSWLTGKYYIVKSDCKNSEEFVALNLRSNKKLRTTIHKSQCEMQLIGNNYQPKDMNKALREVRT